MSFMTFITEEIWQTLPHDGASIMIFGSLLLVVVHALFAMPIFNNWIFALILMFILGAAFSLVPSAMWPSVPKIIPEKNLGTAYSLIYWVQNLGMWAVPIYIGRTFTNAITETGNHAQEVQAALKAEYIFILLGIIAIAVAFMLFLSSKKHPELALDEAPKK